MIEAVLFDLDDTLFDQRQWLEGAWLAVSAAAATYPVDTTALHRALREVAAEGSDQGRIIDRALARVGFPGVPVAPLVDAFRSHRPQRLQPYPGVVEALDELARRVHVGLVTDGDPAIQRSKLIALGLDAAFDVTVFSDELGRDRRKPHPAPFRRALDLLGLRPGRVVHVGDRPGKDTAGATAAGMRAVRVRTGEYRDVPDDPAPWATASDLAAAVALLEPQLPTSPGSGFVELARDGQAAGKAAPHSGTLAPFSIFER